MKSKITLNDRKRTHFLIYPIKDAKIDENNPEEFYNKLNSDLADRQFIRVNKNKGYKITVWLLDNYVVLALCLVNEFKTQNCSIWIAPYTKEDLEDMKSCAKFLSENYSTIVNDFTEQELKDKEFLDNIEKQRLIKDIAA